MTEADRTHAGRKTDPGFEWSALRDLAPFLWPVGNFELRARVVIALTLLAVAKMATVYDPILYKEDDDILDGAAGSIVALAIGLLFAYVIVRVLSISFAELRYAVFA